MCGRFTLTVPSYEELASALGVQAGVWAAPPADVGASYRPRYNIAPTDATWIVRMARGVRELVPADWGLVPRWSKTPMQAGRPINARAESVNSKPTFRESFEQRRCLVVADGFFEWEKVGRQRLPVWFRPAGGGLLLMGGLWDEWGDRETGRVMRSFAIVTTAANDDVSFLHDRMPLVIADEASIAGWLPSPGGAAESSAGPDVQALLRPGPAGSLQATRVSQRVNSVKNDDPAVLGPPELEQRKAGMLSLFPAEPPPSSRARTRARR